ncbi:MAG: NmrA family NAD(P)-binding protein [Spirochaetales bacterium]
MSEANGILVTGATGNVGSEVCKNLQESGRPIYGAVIAPEVNEDGTPTERTASRLYGSEPRGFDFTNESTWASALEGVQKVFLMRPPHISKIKRDMYPFMQFMKERGIEHVVFLSVQGVENNKMIPHYKVEESILELGIPYTFIRPSFFMQNMSTTHLSEIRDESRIFVPAGDGVTNFIDVRDIGEAVARALLGDEHKNRAYTVTGEVSYSYYEVAERLSEILGRTITYEPARAIPFLRYQKKQGRKLGHALVMYVLYSVTRLGKAGVATEAFGELTGRKPRSLDEFIRDHKAALGAAVS